ncbi:hypothetical protein IWX90DRAFT_418507 [Phyllosticta citrichinensis]|uniref:Uncharacterized protein n=1 Tax=Phyllosticta citrichinensis TaxID=1130410 RepID=A0ABR1XGZ4_9PEZI
MSKKRSSTAAELGAHASKSSARQNDFALEEALQFMDPDQFQGILRKFAPKVSPLRDRIVTKYNEEVDGAFSRDELKPDGVLSVALQYMDPQRFQGILRRVVNFDWQSKSVWKELNVTHDRKRGSAQYDAAGGAAWTIERTIKSIADNAHSETSFRTRRNALITLRKIGKSIALSVGVVPREVRKDYTSDQDCYTDAFLEIAKSFTRAERAKVLQTDQDGLTFEQKLVELVDLARGYCIFPKLRRSLSVLQEETSEDEDEEDDSEGEENDDWPEDEDEEEESEDEDEEDESEGDEEDESQDEDGEETPQQPSGKPSGSYSGSDIEIIKVDQCPSGNKVESDSDRDGDMEIIDKRSGTAEPDSSTAKRTRVENAVDAGTGIAVASERKSKEESDRRRSLVKEFGPQVQEASRVLDPAHKQESVSDPDAQSAYDTVAKIISYVGDESEPPSSFETRMKAIMALRKIGQLTLDCEGPLDRQVREKFKSSCVISDVCIDIAKSFNKKPKAIVLRAKEEAETFDEKFVEWFKSAILRPFLLSWAKACTSFKV